MYHDIVCYVVLYYYDIIYYNITGAVGNVLPVGLQGYATKIYTPPPINIVAIFYPFSQFCEINISLLSLQTQPKTAPNLFQRGVEYGKYE